jgi:uncharacterized protein (DUF305 family)
MARRRLAGPPARPGWLRPQVAVSLAAVLVAAVIGAVSSSPGRDAAPRSAHTASWNPTDTAYVQAMLWHQEQAQELASLVQGRTTCPELLGLALSIHTAQTSDVAPMAAWLRAHAPAADDLVHLATKPADRWFAGMMANTQLRTLAASNGQRFDFLFVDMLVEHHKGAIVMADGVTR